MNDKLFQHYDKYDHHELFLLAINVTKRCNLACEHCYLDADTLKNGQSDELSLVEVNLLLDEVASRSTQTMVVLTGGEPLARSNLEAMIQHGADLGLSMVVGTNGTLLTSRRVASLKSAGALGLGISVDSLHPTQHDQFRGLNGSWKKTFQGIQHCREQDLSFQIHFTVTSNNYSELNAIICFAYENGARVLNLFFLICTGRAESTSDITPEQYEQVLTQTIQAQTDYPDMIIRPRCAPHYKRIAHQLNPDSPITRVSGFDGDGCIAGTHYCRVAPNGDVTACPYIDTASGNIRQQSFLSIWDNANEFQSLRKPLLKGACGECEYKKLCGGCRARPLAMGGDLMDSDPYCAYVPEGGNIIEPFQEIIDKSIIWHEEARQRLSRIPGFLQKMIKKRAEAYVLELGETVVKAEHLSNLASKRFGSKLPFSKPSPGQSKSTSDNTSRESFS
ncbi:MAG: radical SAM protein [gamma proteobacterium symbiont of Taylorina sp.]|nr:radical SAM protein [gamma proteobacterium symbiont of Taylorina sp.]